MTLTELRYIIAVARERHFGRAAQSCFVSQPTLSVAVKKLEEELDVTLFERGASEIVLTPVGKQVVAQAQQGDSEALAKLILRYQDRIFNTILKKVVPFFKNAHLLSSGPTATGRPIRYAPSQTIRSKQII